MSGARTWWSADDLAGSGLPSIPTSKRHVNRLAESAGWRTDPKLFRRIPGKGGGWQYHRNLLPSEALAALLAREARAEVEVPKAPDGPGRDAAWAMYEAAPESAREQAAQRLEVLQQVQGLKAAGVGRTVAVAYAAQEAGIGVRTIYAWEDLVLGVRIDDRLAYLLPRTSQRGPSANRADVDPEFGSMVRDDYLRLSKPSLKSAYDRQVRLAEKRGIPTVGYKAIQRWMKREVSRPMKVLAREGVEALKQIYPAQVRDKTALHAMEAVNGDVHRFDVFVKWPGGPGLPEEVIRPQMVAFQDLYSGKLLAWRVDRTPNAHATKLCIGDMIERFGIPQHVTLDNGREFAAKAITGGTPTRFRFKVREDDMPGLLTQLGCDIHWAQPYSGQSKPIERAFRDLCDRVSKHPAFEGAYTGNRPDAKPENYGSRAVPLDEFLAVLAEEMEAHNTRQGRRSEVAYNRSFAEVFDESYAEATIRKATEEQRRLWMMGAENLRAHAKTGEINLMGNAYWSDWMTALAGQKVVARFDPAALWDGIHVYDAAGRYQGHAECREKVGFYDVDEARVHAKARRDWMNAEKKALAALRKRTALEIGADLAAIAPEPAVAPDATVIAPVFGKRPTHVPEAPTAEEVEAQAAIVADLDARRTAVAEEAEVDEDRARFRGALDLMAKRDAGEALTKEQGKFLERYVQTSDYRAQRALYEDFGDAMFAGM